MVMHSKLAICALSAGLAVPHLAHAQFCDHAWSGVLCVSCATYPGDPAYVSYWWGCQACISPCKIYLQGESVPAAEDLAKAAVARNPTLISRQLRVDADQVREIGERNPWAASILLGLAQNGQLADIKGGTSYLSVLPSSAAVAAALAGDDAAAKSLSAPATVQARVIHRLERNADAARLYFSSVVVDDDARVLYRVFPDIVVELYETNANVVPQHPNATAIKEAASPGPARQLIVKSWSVGS